MTPSSLHYDVWYRELEGDDHPDNVDLLQGIRDGFHIVDASGLPDHVQMSNYKSATCSDNFGPVESQIIEEISEGRLIVTDDPPRLVSALGAIPKSSKGVRLIHDYNRPMAVPLMILPPLGTKVRFQSLDDAVQLLQPGGYSAKVDLKSAYRSVKIYASNFPFTGLSWFFSGDDDPTFMYDFPSEACWHLRFSIFDSGRETHDGPPGLPHCRLPWWFLHSCPHLWWM